MINKRQRRTIDEEWGKGNCGDILNGSHFFVGGFLTPLGNCERKTPPRSSLVITVDVLQYFLTLLYYYYFPERLVIRA